MTETEQPREDEATEGQDATEAPEPTVGDQGPWEKGLQDAAPANAEQAGFDPNRAVRTSPPAPEEQSGVPNIPANEGVEAPSKDDEPSSAPDTERFSQE